MDLKPIKVERSLTGMDTDWRTGDATKGGEWEPLKILFREYHHDLKPIETHKAPYDWVI
jgi:hypothetical protein